MNLGIPLAEAKQARRGGDNSLIYRILCGFGVERPFRAKVSSGIPRSPARFHVSWWEDNWRTLPKTCSMPFEMVLSCTTIFLV